MSEPTRAEAAVMENAAKQFESVKEGLDGMLNRLMGELSALQAGWTGRGAMSFDTVRLEWQKDQQRMIRALEQTAGAIRTAGRTYDSTDDSAAGQINAVGGARVLPL